MTPPEFSRRSWVLSVLAVLAILPRRALARSFDAAAANASPPPTQQRVLPSSVGQEPPIALIPSGATGSISGKLKTIPPKAARWGVVYLEDAPLGKPVPGKLQSTVKMKFVPFLQVMTKGEKLIYVNTAPFPDNAMSPSGEKWDFGMVGAGGVRVRTMGAAGAYTVLCQIHPQELAFIVVSPSSYFATTDAKGAFAIPNVPHGTYEIVAWAPRMKPERQTIIVQGDATVEFALRK